MAVSGISSQENILQALRAQNAFQKAVKNNNEIPKSAKLPDEHVKISISSKNISNLGQVSDKGLQPRQDDIEVYKPKNPYVSEIQEFANKYQINSVQEEEIEEALKYGTSLFADYTA